MNIIKGIGTHPLITIGKLFFYEGNDIRITKKNILDTKSEIERFESAKEIAVSELNTLYKNAVLEIGEADAMIFQIHQMMLEDDDYILSVKTIIEAEKANAEYAVSLTAKNFSDMLRQTDDEYMQSRSADISDISNRVIKILSGTIKKNIQASEPVIIVAKDLTPSEIIEMDKSKMLGFITFNGSTTSHTSILSKTMNIPAIVATNEISTKYNSHPAILDGESGLLYIDPDSKTLEELTRKKSEKEFYIKSLYSLKGKPSTTVCGNTINIFANIGFLGDVDSAIENDAEGIGLFRSEFMYIGRNSLPTEDELFNVYKSVCEKMNEKTVVIRTIDIGADKSDPVFNLPSEKNPALGYRAVRICLKELALFKTQIRAILRASWFGSIKIMFPMIISLDEILEIKKIVNDAKAELSHENTPFDNAIKLGIMIETPAAALISDILAKEVDFFSIGTNDLSQYTLAVDRENEKLQDIYNPHHPAILRLIKLVIENGHREGIKVAICGELAGDASITKTLIEYGIDELSVIPNAVLPIRKIVCETKINLI